MGIMRTSSKPWYRKGVGAWYVKIDGKQVFLSRDKAEARLKWLKLMKEGVPQDHRLRDCVDDYLASLSESSRRSRQTLLNQFMRHVGDVKVSRLTERHVETFMQAEWSNSTRRTYVKTILACLNHAVRTKKITDNPIKNVQKPTWERRETLITEVELSQLLEHATGPFLQILTAIVKTGVRPGEICALEIADCFPDQNLWLVPNKTRATTGIKKRPVYLSEELVALTRELIDGRTGGPLFRTRLGTAWNPETLEVRMRALRKKLGLSGSVIAYGLRHKFASDAINGGVDSVIVAKLMGHTNPTMLMKHYFHEDAQAMVDAVTKIGKKSTDG
jgi:integrase